MKDREYKASQVGIEVIPSWHFPGHSDVLIKGLYNGYVTVTKEHPWYGLSYADTKLDGIEVHGGLTYSGEGINKDIWRFGFDTAHFGDTPERWTFDAVLQETLRLRQQFADVGMAYEKLMS